MKTILVTGATGSLGSALRHHLNPDHRLRLFARTAAPNPTPNETVLTGDMGDRDAVEEAVRGVDAILHLACRHGETVSFEDTLDANYRGTVFLMEAALRHGVRNVVYASSNHGWGLYPRSHAPLSDTAPPRPDGWYGISKIWTEAVLAFYGEAHGITATSLRIGNCSAEVADERRTHMWISFRDLAQLVRLSLARTDPGHRAVFATADCAAPFFDNSGAKALGFVTTDRPEDHLSDPSIAGLAPEGSVFGLAMGGSYAATNFKADIARLEGPQT